MAVRRSFNAINQVRVSVPDFRGIESAVRWDFDELLSGLITGSNKPMVVRGFEIEITSAVWGNSASSLQLLVANSSILHTTASQAGTFFTISDTAAPQTLNVATNPKVTGSFVANATNYIGIDYSRTADSSTSIQRYVWSPATQSEFVKTAPQSELLDYQIVITSTVFAANVLPIAAVLTDGSNAVISIEDRRPLLFRLGTAGSSTPNPDYEYPLNRIENPYLANSGTTSPFRGGDKEIKTMKEMFDALMTEIKLMKGQPYWFSPSTGGSIYKLRNDTANTVITSKGSVVHNATNPGQINWTRDLNLVVVGSRLKYVVEANPSSTDITLADNEVAYLALKRDVGIAPVLNFTSGSDLVSAPSLTPWTNDLEAGDFIKIADQDDDKYYQILAITNTYTVQLTETFPSTLSNQNAVYAFGKYRISDLDPNREVKIGARKDVAANQDNYWLYLRQDADVPAPASNTITTVADVAGSLNGTNFKLFSNDNLRQYRFMFTDGTAVAPVLDLGETLVTVPLIFNSSANTIAETLADIIDEQEDFSAAETLDQILVINTLDGAADAAEDVDTGFTFAQTNPGAKAKVYARFFGSELEQGESRQVSDNENLELITYIGAKSESDAFPKYVSAFEQFTAQTAIVTVPAAAAITTGQSFKLYSSNNKDTYRVWFNKDVGGGNPSDIDELPVEVAISTGFTNLQNAAALASALSSYPDFSVTDNLDGTVTIDLVSGGRTDYAENVDVGGLSIAITAIGSGVENKYILDSESLTKAIKRLDMAFKSLEETLTVVAYEEEYSIVTGAPANIYELTGPIVSGTNLTLPLDSKRNGAKPGYIVGDDQLELYLNGVYLRKGATRDWIEVGTSGDKSTTIQILVDLDSRDKLQFRIDPSAGIAGGSLGGAGEANTASNAGLLGAGVFKTKVGVDLQFRRLVAGSGMTITQGTDAISLSSAPSTAIKAVRTVTTSDAIVVGDDYIRVLNSGSDLTVTLPSAVNAGKELTIKKIDAGNILYIATISNETIDGTDATATPLMVTAQYEAITIIANGFNWEII